MPLPYISIVVPVYNEAALLERCLRSLQAQICDHPFEIIVVDNASTDDSAEIAARCGVRVISEPNKGVCAARQAGIVAAGGEVVVSTDADCEYPEGWLRSIERRFRRQRDLTLLIGTYRFSHTPGYNRLLGAWEQLTIRLYYAFGWQLYVSAANLAFRRVMFSGYDTSLGSGGDELYVVRQLRGSGRTSFVLDNPVTTSARRLDGRFFAALLHDFGVKYIGSFLFRRRADHVSTPADIRQDEQAPPSWWHNLLGFVAVGLIIVGCLIGVWWTAAMLLALPAQPLTFIGVGTLLIGIQAYCIFWPTSQLYMPSPWRVRTPEKLVALTFDDGPNEPFTSQIAAIIESYGGRATFFQCGKMVGRDTRSTARLVAAGHTVGNHTYSHSFWALWQPKRLLSNIRQTNATLHDAGVPSVRFFRSPWLTKTPIVSWVVRQAGLLPVAGRFVSLSEVRQLDGNAMAEQCLRHVRPGSIIILHDSQETRGGDRIQTVRAVKELCAQLAAQGYDFVSLDELL